MTFPHPPCTRCGRPLDGLDHDGYVHDYCPRRGLLAVLLRKEAPPMMFLRRRRPCHACGKTRPLRRVRGYRVCASCRPFFTRRGSR